MTITVIRWIYLIGFFAQIVAVGWIAVAVGRIKRDQATFISLLSVWSHRTPELLKAIEDLKRKP